MKDGIFHKPGRQPIKSSYMEKASQLQRESKKGQGSFFTHGEKTATPFFDGPESTAPGKFIQAKLSVNQPGDSYEQEADQVAEKVVNGGSAPAQGSVKTAPAPIVSRKQ